MPLGTQGLGQMKMERSLTAFPTGHYLGSAVETSSSMAAAETYTCHLSQNDKGQGAKRQILKRNSIN